VNSLSDDPQDPQVQSSKYHPQGYFSPFCHFVAPFQSRSYLMIPKIPKFSKVRILKDTFTILTLFLLILTVTINWWSPRPSSPTLWGSTGILYKTNLALFHHFPVEFLSDDPKTPKLTKVRILNNSFVDVHTCSSFFSSVLFQWSLRLPDSIQQGSSRSFSTFWHVYTIFAWNSLLKIPKAPKSNSDDQEGFFTILTLSPQTFSEVCSRLIIPKAPRPNQQWVHKDSFHCFDTFWPFFSVVFI
jgi:hypothetical protein